MSKALRFLLDVRTFLIGMGIIIGMSLVMLKGLYAGAVVLEPPHIEGGVEVTIQNMINDAKREGTRLFEPKPDPDPEPEPIKNEWGIREDMIARGCPWIK